MSSTAGRQLLLDAQNLVCLAEDGRELAILLAKGNQMEWWKSVIKGHAEIDTQKVEPENSKLGDLDAETRQTVEKMMVRKPQSSIIVAVLYFQIGTACLSLV